MKRVLGIVGSPRKGGNTETLVSAVLNGVRRAGAATDVVRLADLTIKECDGCHACWKGRPCRHRDDMNAVYAKIVAADALVLGTPVYWYGPTALMKAFVDRLVYFNCPANRARIRGKAAVIVVPFEETDPATVAPVVAFFEKCLGYLEMDLVGRVIVPGVTKRGEVRRKPPVLKQAGRIGANLARPTRGRAR